MTEQKSWSALIRQIRSARHWSQDALAEYMQTDQTSVSRWERGLVVPGPAARRKLDSLANDLGRQSLAGVEPMVRTSPFPMILVARSMQVVAASASSGFHPGRSVLEQTPADEHQHFLLFYQALERQGFWEMASVHIGDSIEYAFERGVEIAGAVVVPILVGGETYALVQKRPG